MTFKKIIAGVVLAGAMAACQNTPNDITVAEYCADADRAGEPVCQVSVDLNGTRTALADTDMRLGDARAMADAAMSAAEAAQTSADEAKQMARSALAASSSIDNLQCITNTINQTDVGTCPSNMRLMSCTQTRYTTRAGRLSFLREINDEQCRFASRVLEMQVRCCTVAAGQQAGTSSAIRTNVRREAANTGT